MAGFAVVITMFTYGILGLIGACVLSLILYKFAKGRVLDAGLTRHRLTREAAAASFLGLLWLVVALLLHVAISNRFAHQDCGLSGDPYVTLPNGYKLGSLHTYSGYIVAPGFQTDVRPSKQAPQLFSLCSNDTHGDPDHQGAWNSA